MKAKLQDAVAHNQILTMQSSPFFSTFGRALDGRMIYDELQLTTMINFILIDSPLCISSNHDTSIGVVRIRNHQDRQSKCHDDNTRWCWKQRFLFSCLKRHWNQLFFLLLRSQNKKFFYKLRSCKTNFPRSLLLRRLLGVCEIIMATTYP